MAHVPVPEGLPGIVGLLDGYPETGRALRAFVEVLQRGPSSLSQAERELIATHVSAKNHCGFCMNSHAAAARHLWGERAGVVDAVIADPATDELPEKMRALLAIAGKVQGDARQVDSNDIARAREAGADDRAIHDTVLIAAAFSMFNRYVDGLATEEPADAAAYVPMGAMLAEQGYLRE
jgi:uncharacterized peroxidase-related enzyme